MSYREVFKFLAGAAAWDAIIAAWFLTKGMYPINFFGIVFGEAGLAIVFFADLIIVFLLSYFAWRKPIQRNFKKRNRRR